MLHLSQVVLAIEVYNQKNIEKNIRTSKLSLEAKNIMDVLLSKELESFVSDQVKRGHYLSTDEVIGEALLLLKREEQLKEIQREELRKEIQKGIDQIRAGQSTTYASGEALVEDIISRGMQRLAEKEKQKNG